MSKPEYASWKDLAHSFAGKEMEWQDDSAFRGQIREVKFDDKNHVVTVHFNWVVIKRNKEWHLYQIPSICFDSRTPALKMGEETWKVGQMGRITGLVHMSHRLDQSRIIKPAAKEVAPKKPASLIETTA